MSDLNSDVLKLTRRIYAGKCNVNATKACISSLEAKYGAWDMPVDLPNKQSMSDKEYLDTLDDIINAGVFSKEALLEMAKTAENVYGDKGIDKKYIVVAIAVVVCLIVTIIIALSGGKD